MTTTLNSVWKRVICWVTTRKKSKKPVLVYYAVQLSVNVLNRHYVLNIIESVIVKCLLYLEAEFPREVLGVVGRVPEEHRAREVVWDGLLQPEPRGGGGRGGR